MSMPVSVDSRSFRQAMAALQRRAPEAARRGLRDAGEEVLADAMTRCPVLTGALMGSGTLDDSQLDAGVVKVGFNTDYAAMVHERTDVHHSQGEAKFLETAVKTSLPRIGRAIARELRSELR